MAKDSNFGLKYGLGDMSLSNRFPNLYNCSVNKDCSVAEFYSTNGWQINPRRGFNDWEFEEVGQLLQLLDTTVVEEDKEDLMVWTASNDL